MTGGKARRSQGEANRGRHSSGVYLSDRRLVPRIKEVSFLPRLWNNCYPYARGVSELPNFQQVYTVAWEYPQEPVHPNKWVTCQVWVEIY